VKHNALRVVNDLPVMLGNRRSQAAEMVLAAGDAEEGTVNRHRGANLWLNFLGGTGSATVDGRRLPLKAVILVLIKRDETHQIRNTGRGELRTLNFYVPPAYTAGGNKLPPAKPSGKMDGPRPPR
jgi:mannose-6-phosphate isomerase-like protein (cupin superfamily)